MVSNRPNGPRRLGAALLLVMLLTAFTPGRAAAASIPPYEFTGIAGIAAAPDGSLLVADPGAGIVELRKGKGSLVVALPGVADVDVIGRGAMFAITSGGVENSKLYRVSRDEGAVEIADLGAYENTVNPDGREVNPNPFDVATLNGGKALVTDAGGNTLLLVDMDGTIETVAILPDQIAPTDHLKSLVGCPDAPAEAAFACGLPPAIEAQAVATSVAVGPDGAFYVSELTGFPGPQGLSRVWRIEPDARNADCAVSPACSTVLSGFTSIVDLAFGPDGKLYVLELDEAGFMALELQFFGLPPALQGGTVNACDLASGSCTIAASGLTIPLAVEVDKNNRMVYSIFSLIPTAAQVIAAP